MKEFSIQPAQVTDLVKIRDIYLDWYKDDAEGADYFIRLVSQSINGTGSDPSEVYIVFKTTEGQVEGVLGYRNALKKFSPYFSTSNPLEIYALFVSDQSLKNGIGTSLVSYAKEFGIKNGNTELIARSASLFKESGWPFYIKLGFEEKGEIPEPSGEASKVFSIPLK